MAWQGIAKEGQEMQRHLRHILVLAALVVALALPSSALAQGSAVDTYGGSGGEVQNELDNGALPMTGSDTLVLGLGGLVLIAVGAGIAKLAARDRTVGPVA